MSEALFTGPRSEERPRGWKGLVVGSLLVVLLGLWEFFGFDITGPSNRDLALFLGTRCEEFFRRAWDWFAVVVVQVVFNTDLRVQRFLRTPQLAG